MQSWRWIERWRKSRRLFSRRRRSLLFEKQEWEEDTRHALRFPRTSSQTILSTVYPLFFSVISHFVLRLRMWFTWVGRAFNDPLSHVSVVYSLLRVTYPRQPTASPVYSHFYITTYTTTILFFGPEKRRQTLQEEQQFSRSSLFLSLPPRFLPIFSDPHDTSRREQTVQLLDLCILSQSSCRVKKNDTISKSVVAETLWQQQPVVTWTVVPK